MPLYFGSYRPRCLANIVALFFGAVVSTPAQTNLIAVEVSKRQ
jgi:hypothetical protein